MFKILSLCANIRTFSPLADSSVNNVPLQTLFKFVHIVGVTHTHFAALCLTLAVDRVHVTYLFIKNGNSDI